MLPSDASSVFVQAEPFHQNHFAKTQCAVLPYFTGLAYANSDVLTSPGWHTANALDVLLKAQENERGKAQQHELILHAVHSREQAPLVQISTMSWATGHMQESSMGHKQMHTTVNQRTAMFTQTSRLYGPERTWLWPIAGASQSSPSSCVPGSA